jgi:hypothetical protein
MTVTWSDIILFHCNNTRNFTGNVQQKTCTVDKKKPNGRDDELLFYTDLSRMQEKWQI